MSEAVCQCGLYTRVSSRSQMESDYGSLETQRERLEAYCDSQGDFEIYRVYEDGGYSGSTLGRPALKHMIQDIKEGKIDCVLVYKLDRLARSVKDFHNLIDIFDRYGVKLISTTQSIDTQSPQGRLLRNVLSDFAQFEREMIADRTRDKMQQRAQKGLWNGGTPPYGYTKMDKRLVIDHTEGPRVKFMFEWFQKKPSLAGLRDELHRRGWYTRAGNRWSKTSIDNIVRNPVYAGKVRWKDELNEGRHRPLIDYRLFTRIQSLRRDYSHVTVRTEDEYLLKGLVRCGDCVSFMTPHYTQKRRKDGSVYRIRYYRCSKTMHYDNSICSIKSVNADEIERLVVEDLTELSLNEELLRSSIEDLNRDLKGRLEPLEEEACRIKKRIDEIEANLDRYVKALGCGKLSIRRLEREIERGEADKAALEQQYEELRRQINEQTVSTYNVEVVKLSLDDFRVCFGALTRKEQAEALQCILKEVILEKDKIVLEIFELPELLPGSKNRSKWYPRQDSNLLPSA